MVLKGLPSQVGLDTEVTNRFNNRLSATLREGGSVPCPAVTVVNNHMFTMKTNFSSF